MLSVGESEIAPLSLAWYAAAIGLYIVGVTVYAKREESDSQSAMLTFGLIFEVAGLVLVAGFPVWSKTVHTWQLDPNLAYPLLMVLIGLTVVQRGILGINHAFGFFQTIRYPLAVYRGASWAAHLG